MVTLKSNDPYCHLLSRLGRKIGGRRLSPREFLEPSLFNLRTAALQKGNFYSFAEKDRGPDHQMIVITMIMVELITVVTTIVMIR